jgi:hypothetical protein
MFETVVAAAVSFVPEKWGLAANTARLLALVRQVRCSRRRSLHARLQTWFKQFKRLSNRSNDSGISNACLLIRQAAAASPRPQLILAPEGILEGCAAGLLTAWP